LSESEVARQSVNASFILIVANFSSTAISTVTVLIVARLLGPQFYGLYTLALTSTSIFVLFAGWGLNTSIVRYTSFHLSRDEYSIARRKIMHSIEFVLVLGSLFSLISYFSAPVIAITILHRPQAILYIQLSSFVVLGQVILQTAISSFIGWTATRYAGIAYLVQSTVKAMLSILLVLFGFGIIGAIFGQVGSYIVAASWAVITFWILKLRGGIRPIKFKVFLSDIKAQLRFGFPSEFASNLSNFVSTSYIIILLSSIATNAVVGWFQAASNITIAISLISGAITTALFPAFSTLEGKKADTKLAFKYSVKYTAFSITPIILFLAASSRSLIEIIYGDSYLPASPFLTLMAVGFLPIIIGLTTFPAFFNGIGKSRFTSLTLLSSVPPVVLCGPVLGQYLGAYGLIFAVIISDIVTCVTGFAISKHYLSATISFKSSAKILLVGILCTIPVYIVSMFMASQLALFLIEAIIFFGLYLTISPLARTIDQTDVSRLKIVTTTLGPFSKVLAIILKYESLIIAFSVRALDSSQNN
jgi:O-antigen/teichoic acid export membrane protein